MSPAAWIPALAGALLATALTGPDAGATAANPAPVTVPAIRSWQGGEGTWRLTTHSRIVLDAEDRGSLRGTAEQLAEELDDQEGMRPAVTTGRPRVGDVALDLTTNGPTPSKESYTLGIGPAARVSAAGRAGVLYGTRTLLQALRTAPVARVVARGTVRDWPTQASRGQMLDVGR
ncbi:glycoside hydrolase family 20 zincin-like fold domain-containing protein [Streptomyces sp. NPDC091376]|uniref:glycoside hydrolase family 20 zincin-like fold domain-containing protein n=1 Tax=Streptomyces sp. NPDC091376 TaxID=3365994 RepID=UPI003812F9DE